MFLFDRCEVVCVCVHFVSIFLSFLFLISNKSLKCVCVCLFVCVCVCVCAFESLVLFWSMINCLTVELDFWLLLLAMAREAVFRQFGWMLCSSIFHNDGANTDTVGLYALQFQFSRNCMDMSLSHNCSHGYKCSPQLWQHTEYFSFFLHQYFETGCKTPQATSQSRTLIFCTLKITTTLRSMCSMRWGFYFP